MSIHTRNVLIANEAELGGHNVLGFGTGSTNVIHV